MEQPADVKVEPIEDPGEEPVDEGKQAEVLGNQRLGGPDLARVLDGIGKKQPINIIGYMGAGKTTLAKLLGEHYGYTVREEELWDELYAFIGKPEKVKKSDFYNEVGKSLPELLKNVIQWAVEIDEHVFDGVVVNSWIPWLPGPFLNIVMFVEADAVITNERDMDKDFDTQDHYSTMRDRVGTHLSEGNVIVLETMEDRDYLTSLLLGEEE